MLKNVVKFKKLEIWQIFVYFVVETLSTLHHDPQKTHNIYNIRVNADLRRFWRGASSV